MEACEVCGDEFMATRKRLVCGPICRAKQAQARLGARPMDEPVPCDWCGKGFLRRGPSERTCSPNCFSKRLRDRYREAQLAGPRSALGCQTCAHWGAKGCRLERASACQPGIKSALHSAQRKAVASA